MRSLYKLLALVGNNFRVLVQSSSADSHEAQHVGLAKMETIKSSRLSKSRPATDRIHHERNDADFRNLPSDIEKRQSELLLSEDYGFDTVFGDGKAQVDIDDGLNSSSFDEMNDRLPRSRNGRGSESDESSTANHDSAVVARFSGFSSTGDNFSNSKYDDLFDFDRDGDIDSAQWSDTEVDAKEEVDPISILCANGLWDFKRERPTGTLSHDGMALRLTRFIDEGGNGVVIGAQAPGGREYALKFVVQTDEIGSDSIEEEYAVLSQLQSEGGIERLYGSLGELSDEYSGNALRFMTLEALRHTYRTMTEHRLSQSLAARLSFVAGFAYYAILTLQKVHEVHGFSHCDIHASAFMSAKDGSYRLIDFGKARSALVRDDEVRGSINQEGDWISVDKVSLLSPNELQGSVCRPRDDLIRLGALLISTWPTSVYKVGEREFESNMHDAERGSQTTSREMLEKWIDWKRNMSFKSLFGEKRLMESLDSFPRGSNEGASFLEVFYEATLSLGPGDEIPYDRFLSLFVSVDGGLSPADALVIREKYIHPTIL